MTAHPDASAEFQFVSQLPSRDPSERSARISRFAEALRANEGQWGRWPTEIADASIYSTATHIRRGRYKAFIPGTFESVVREGAVFVRYIGPEQGGQR